MTDNQFSLGLLADPAHTQDGRDRLRYIVADALRERAKERQAEGRPDVAGRLRWAAGRLDAGLPITKRVMRKLRADVEAVRARLVDGEPV